jgi:hypothetical protein
MKKIYLISISLLIKIQIKIKIIKYFLIKIIINKIIIAFKKDLVLKMNMICILKYWIFNKT